MPARGGGPAVADDPSFGGGWGVVAHSGAGSGGGVGGDCGRAGACAGAARHVVAAVVATACGGGFGSGPDCRAGFWIGMLRQPAVRLVEGLLDPARDILATAGQLTLTLPVAAHRGAADAGAGGVPWRHQRCAADRARGGGGAVVPGAWPGRRHCGAARCRGPWSRGDFPRRRAVADGWLVHQPLSGAARCWGARC